MTINKQALASLKIENKKPSTIALLITSDFLEHKITSSQAIARIKEAYGK